MPVRAIADVDAGAIERNARRLAGGLAGAELCAVVKADGYGHGLLAAAAAARRGGARWLAVAAAEEARALRAGGVDGRVLVMGVLSAEELEIALEADADVVAWREGFVARLAALGRGRVHVKLDTGMGRLGTRDAAEADRVVGAVRAAPGLELVGAMTHFATADLRGDAFMAEQLARFRAFTDRHPGLVRHAANSAATLRDPATHLDMARCGIALYGLDPFGIDPDAAGLEPALALRSYVAEVKTLAAGESTGYGRRFVASAPTRVAIVPIGYGDGWRRGLSDNAEVLIGGRRRRLVGTVSMDNIAVELGEPVAGVGEEVVLIGRQGRERILAEEVARRLETINYEITCAITARVPRRIRAAVVA